MSHSFRSPQFIASLTRAAAGSSNPFSASPTDLSSLVAWWKADSLALTDGTAIPSWTDSSGSGNTLTATGTQQPTLKTSVYNGFSTVRFNGSSNLMLFTNQITFAGDFTIVAVVKSSIDSILFGDFSTNIQIRKNRSGANNISKYFNSADQTSDNFSSAQGALVACGWRRSSSVVLFRENTTDRNSAGDGAAFNLNRMGFVSYGQVFTGDMCEACIYTANHSNSEVDNLYNNYFKPKWGLP